MDAESPPNKRAVLEGSSVNIQSIAFLAGGFIASGLLIRELIAHGIYRTGFFNYRIIWLVMGWTAYAFAVQCLLEMSN